MTVSRQALPPRRTLVAVWLAAALGFGGLLALAGARRGPLDDADPAHQRPGFLDAFALPEPAPRLSAGLPATGRPTVLFFERPGRLAELCDALASSPLGEAAQLVVVVAGPKEPCPGAAVVADPGGELVRVYGLRRPAGGGPPVGYAVVDGRGRIRYRTLDPSMAYELAEVDTIVEAL